MPLPVAPQYVGTATTFAHVRRALEFSQKEDVYAVIGKTSAWPDDNNPPTPDPETTVIPEALGYVKVQQNTLIVPDVAGPIELYQIKWRTVADVDAYTEKARHVWLQGEFQYDDVPVAVSYRMVGITTGLTKQPLVPPLQTLLLPADVLDPGVLEYVYHDQPIPRAINRRDILNVIITF